MSKLVVLGAGGFIGQHLVKALAENTNDQVRAFDRFSNYRKGDDHPFIGYKNVELFPGNFLNRNDLSKVLDKADYVFHLVSTTNPATSGKDPFIDIDTNVRGSVQLFELCVESGVKKVIFPSSGGTVYGNAQTELINETVVPTPSSPYGIGKLFVEHYLRYFKRANGLDYVVYRIANPYGPGQNIFGKQGVIPIFMYKFLKNEPITVYGDGSMIRDYLYISDLIDMMAGSYAKNNKFSEYNLSSGQGVTVNQIIESIEGCTGHKITRQHKETPPTFVHKSVLDNSRFVDEFGIRPSTTLEDGIGRTWEYVKQFQ